MFSVMIENRQISLLTMRLRKAFRSLRTFEHCRAFHSLSLSCVEKLLRGRRKKSFKNAYKLRKVGTSFPLKYTLNTILIYRAAFLTRTLHSFHNNREKVMPSKNHIHRRFNAFTWELFLDKLCHHKTRSILATESLISFSFSFSSHTCRSSLSIGG